MLEEQTFFSKPYVIVVSGAVGSGKSTVAARLSKMLEDAPVLTFDHYERYVEWPQDIGRWMHEGADPSEIRVPRLKEDLLSLLAGKTIADPRDGKVLSPANHIILEEPSGRERQEIRDYIDLVAFIDVPQDVCVSRLVERALEMAVWQSKGTFAREPKEDLVRQLDAVALWLTQYRRARSMYIQVSRIVKEKADLVVDGMKPVDEITADIVKRLMCRQGV
jgi:uridine kinase